VQSLLGRARRSGDAAGQVGELRGSAAEREPGGVREPGGAEMSERRRVSGEPPQYGGQLASRGEVRRGGGICQDFREPGDWLVENGQAACLGFDRDQAECFQRGGRDDEQVVVSEDFPQPGTRQPAEPAQRQAGRARLSFPRVAPRR
jgi:hypothetical protein